MERHTGLEKEGNPGGGWYQMLRASKTEGTAEKKIITSLNGSDINLYIPYSPESVCQAVNTYILVVPRDWEDG